MNYNPCIIILTHPNTEEKLTLLSNCISQLKKTKYPIYLFSNMDIKSEVLETISGFIYTGENKMYSASDFLDAKKITEARNTTKYKSHLKYGDGKIITYTPINYGTEKSYYWACTNLYKTAFEFVKDNSYTHFMLTQYDTIIPDSDLHLIDENFNEINLNGIDGSFPVDPNMGENHLNGDVFFGQVKWWNELFNTMSPIDFYTETFPNWTPEEYFYIKAKQKEGKIKIKVRTNLDEWEKKYYNIIPTNWIKENVDSDTRSPVNLYFPNVTQTGLSNFWDTPYFDIEKSLIISIQPFKDVYQMFVWNQSISKRDKNININVNFPAESDSDIKINDLDFEMLPGVWTLRYITENLKNRKVIIECSYIDNDELVANSKTYYL
jgi:hypothetical protein